MKEETRELFGGRFPNCGSRFWDDNVCNMTVFDAGYKVVTPMEKGAVPYLSLEKSSSKMHVEDFMLCLGRLHVGNSDTKVFENDVVDYSVKDMYRGVGAIVYCPELFLWAVKDFKTMSYFPLRDVSLNKVLGNLYSCENLIGCNLEEAYDKLRMKIPTSSAVTPCAEEKFDTSNLSVGNRTATEAAAPTQAAAPSPATPKEEPVQISQAETPVVKKENKLDVFINVFNKGNATSWTYTLLSGTHIKTDEGQFHKTGDTGYYVAAAGIIALSNVKKPVPVNVYTPDKTLAFLMQDNRLEKWAKNGWTKDNGQPLKNQPILAELYANIARLGGNISAQVCAPDFKLAV